MIDNRLVNFNEKPNFCNNEKKSKITKEKFNTGFEEPIPASIEHQAYRYISLTKEKFKK